MSTGVRVRPNITVLENKAMALDQGQNSNGLLTPSVIFKCNISSETSWSFYQGQLNVIIKDTVLQPSTSVRHAVEVCTVLRSHILPSHDVPPVFCVR